MPTIPTIKIDNQDLVMDARRDTIDFRDLMYTPTLVEVPVRIDLARFKEAGAPILNQGQEGACTGFGLATVVHYLMHTRHIVPDLTPVSPRMLYEIAKRYDEYPGEAYSGSSARGAMKGWHKHGVCSLDLWKYDPGVVDRLLSPARADDARKRPLGAYFRVNHKDLVAMHSAITEVGILYVTGNVHDGWSKLDKDGTIFYEPGIRVRGGHAFAIVAYDQQGFWIQNSWGPGWGKGGFAKITYDDWLASAMDVWVARLGVPIERLSSQAAAISRSPGIRKSEAYSYVDLRPHVISLGNDGRLKELGTYANSVQDVERIISEDIPNITKDWDKKRIFLYAHGGLVSETGYLQRLAEYRSALLDIQVYPLAFVWHTDLWSTITNILAEAKKQRRPEGILDDALDFMMDRLDDTLEVIVRGLKVKGLWDEMKENAYRATQLPGGGGRLVAECLAKLMDEHEGVEIHVAGHSAGSIFHAPLVQYFTSKGSLKGEGWVDAKGLNKKIASCSLWAPGIRIDSFHQTYLPAIESGGIERFGLFTLTDATERNDHCANVYHKSLLYMVSNALEERYEEPILGMEKFVEADDKLKAIFGSGRARWIKAPNNSRPPATSKAAHHGDFDDDIPTVVSTLADVFYPGKMAKAPVFKFGRSISSSSARRRELG